MTQIEKRISRESNTHIEYEWEEGEIQKCFHNFGSGLVSNRWVTETKSSITSLECTICNVKIFRELARKNGEAL